MRNYSFVSLKIIRLYIDCSFVEQMWCMQTGVASRGKRGRRNFLISGGAFEGSESGGDTLRM